MSGLSDQIIKEKLGRAMRVPGVPGDLVEQNVVRAKAISEGREAEARMEAMEASANPDELAELTAKSVVGRLMLLRMPPKGVTAAQMTEQLRSVSVFRRMLAGSPAETLRDIRTGEFFRRLTESAAPAQQEHMRAPEHEKQPRTPVL